MYALCDRVCLCVCVCVRVCVHVRATAGCVMHHVCVGRGMAAAWDMAVGPGDSLVQYVSIVRCMYVTVGVWTCMRVEGQASDRGFVACDDHDDGDEEDHR